MPAKVFIDTNLVIYSLGKNSDKVELLAPLFTHRPTISTQVLSETANVARKKLGMPLVEIGKLLTMLEATCAVALVSPATTQRAIYIAGRYEFSWFDSLIVASALEVDCDTLYTEDLQHGQVIEDRLTVINPFSI
ncbi:MAG: PIN domain-containing protein [Gallionellaceae bacterium]|nr:PIN domain-containing protein [Gallionellaceae bacterium]